MRAAARAHPRRKPDAAAAARVAPPARVQSGQLELLRQQLRERLIESGWRDELAEQARAARTPATVRTRLTLCGAQCRQIVRQRGYENVTVDQLAQELAPKGRAAVPDRHAQPVCVVLCLPWRSSAN